MQRFSPIFTVALAVFAGCQKTSPSATESFGQFQGTVVAAWDENGRNMTLREPFTYVDAQNRTWHAPAGSVIDGASIPAAFWSAIGGPFEGKFRNASVVHDVGCHEMRESWEDVHRMFYEACRCGGVEELKAKAMYYAVYHFGPRWQPVTQMVTQQRTTADGQIVEQEVAVQRVVRTDPPPPTPEEIEQMEAYVAEENPEPEAIRSFDRTCLHQRPCHKDRRSCVFERGNASSNEGASCGRPMRHSPGNRMPTGPERSRHRSGDGMRAMSPDRGNFRGQPVSNEEQEWLVNMVRQHIEQQAGEQRPAEYAVERTFGGFNVFVAFLHPNEEGELVRYEGGHTTVQVSRRGEILQIANATDETLSR